MSWLTSQNISIAKLESTVTPRTCTLYPLQLSTSKSEIPVTGSTGPRLDNHHEFRLLRVEPHAPLQTPGANCCQILIQQFHHLKTWKWSWNWRTNLTIQTHTLPSIPKDLWYYEQELSSNTYKPQLIQQTGMLTLSNAAEKFNWTCLPSMPQYKATCRQWGNVSKTLHVTRPLRYKNCEAGSRLLLFNKWLNFPATVFSNTFDKRGVTS